MSAVTDDRPLITDQFGNRGIDRNKDGILQSGEIDIRSTAQVGVFGSVVKQPSSNLKQKFSGATEASDSKDEFKTKTMDQILGEINNGRVADINIFDNVTKDTRKDVIMSQNNAESAVKGLVEETALSNYFFSNKNINALQQTIRYRVYQKTNEVIDYQSSNELYIIMRSVLLQHGNFRVSAKDLLQEVLQLNKRVEVYAVNEVASNVVQYKGYLKDVEKLPTPMDRPRYDDNGSRNRTYDLSNHISPMATEGWQSRHKSELLK